MSKIQKLTNPEHLFCEIPIKDGSINDLRSFIYCPKYLSLIEVLPLKELTVAFPKEQFQKEFDYCGEEFLLVFTQNNVALVNETKDVILGDIVKTETEIINEAWAFFKAYLTWEDSKL